MLNKELLYSGVYGFAVGDALGVPVEFTTREMRDKDPVREMRGYGSHNQPIGTWSDDTSMVLATMDAMSKDSWCACGIMENFSKWISQAEYTATGVVFDIGGSTNNALTAYEAGVPAEECGGKSIQDNGNGSLMRMLPLVYYVYGKYGVDISREAVELIYRISGLTHAHIISKVSCVYYVYLGVFLLEHKNDTDDNLQGLIKRAIRAIRKFYDYFGADIEGTNELDLLYDINTYNREDICSTGYAIHTIGACIWCLCNTGSYSVAVETAVNLGGDTDTIGAVTGGLAGIYYGLDSIPSEWINALKNRELIERICNGFMS